MPIAKVRGAKLNSTLGVRPVVMERWEMVSDS
jgi:hypothetical protein